MGVIRSEPIILAIESSCDDTSAAVIVYGEVLSNLTDNQKIHENYGGVVPELASRQHHRKIVPVVQEALKKGGVGLNELDAIAFTQGPGLLGSLLVGCSFSKGLALALNKPLIAVNHMEAHVLAHFVRDPKPKLPFLCLTVSGGHTQIVVMNSIQDMTVVGSTKDDAAGEAFDKIGKFMGLAYPAGPLIDNHAKKGSARFAFPKPNIADLDFSFSGLKTAVLYFLRDQKAMNPNFIDENLEDVCASVQETIVDILLDKLILASEKYEIMNVGIAGGVSANSKLRSEFYRLAIERKLQAYIPDFELCTDNAGMIAMAAHYKFLNDDFVDQKIVPDARLRINKADGNS